MSLPRTIVWFSCGAASAVAAKLMVEKYGQGVRVIYCNTMANEHPDNARFMLDVERWIGVRVEVIGNPKFYTVEAVFEKHRFMSGPKGAKCTIELKKRPRFDFQLPDDRQVFGLTADEGHRIARFEENNPELTLEWALRDAGLDKAACLAKITEAGIELPAMYRLGYANNNCLGCVKATSPAYWNRIRRDFPEAFASRAEQSRRLGARLVRLKGVRIFLDELPANAGEVIVEDLSCGPQCAAT